MNKVSIITVCYNSAASIKRTLESVSSQKYPNIEYIVIDGGSTDGTVEIIRKFSDKISKFISEPDKGIYDALNKGVKLASGNIIAILHSDDEYCDNNVVSNVMQHMNKTKSEFCFSDLVIVDDLSKKVLRYYMANYFKKWMFRIGWMPPHPTCFIKRHLFDEFGFYSVDYQIAGDFDLLVRFFYSREVKWSYLDQITVKMSANGVSNSGWRSKMLIFNEIRRSLKINNVWSLSIFHLVRYIIRILEIMARGKANDCN